MGRFWRSLTLAGLLFAASLLSGCSQPRLTLSPEELYALPTLPAKYTELNTQLNALLESGAEYAAPTSGANIQSVQLVDLDGDGREEAVAFFRNSSEEKPLKIYIFSADGDSYVQTDLIEGSGTSIYSIAYTDLDSDGRLELLVGWKATAELQVLEVYSLRPGGAELLVRREYVKYITADLNQDQLQELVILHADEEGDGVADYYVWQSDGNLSTQSAARLSITMAELNQQGRVTQGTLEGESPALFVTGVTDDARAVTDILAVRGGEAAGGGELTNVALSSLTGVSGVVAPFCALYPADINGDGLTEVPAAVRRYAPEDETSFCQWVEWFGYDGAGQPRLALRTYHSTEDSWYLRLPEAWTERIWIGRSASLDESAVTFSLLEDGRAGTPFLRITAITGSNRETRAVRGNRFLLGRQGETIYTGELLEANETWQHGMSADEVREAFSLVAAEWSAGDY
ncbi:MAG: VCBS repeat-containing protein [Oscillibacter sp.]|nr:VCBS repeat-containing protein [Oscillibacter sp.]